MFQQENGTNCNRESKREREREKDTTIILKISYRFQIVLFLLTFSLDKYSATHFLLFNRKAIWRSCVSFEMWNVRLYRFLHCVVFSHNFWASKNKHVLWLSKRKENRGGLTCEEQMRIPPCSGLWSSFYEYMRCQRSHLKCSMGLHQLVGGEGVAKFLPWSC